MGNLMTHPDGEYFDPDEEDGSRWLYFAVNVGGDSPVTAEELADAMSGCREVFGIFQLMKTEDGDQLFTRDLNPVVPPGGQS